jgi:nitroimidazol reductase NimA-like FMN-containing flavoprotein (pyridoxamine 5'-phosphate oxidase superfamily)
MGIGVWTTGLALWRSVKLKEIAEKRTELEHTPYTELNYLKKLDINNVFFAIISLLLLPILWNDPVLVSIIVAFVAVITTTSLISAHMISRVPWLPPDIFNLVKDSDFAYVGTSGGDMSPHLTPVVYVFDGSRIFFNTSKEAKKLKYLHKNNKIAFLIDKRDLSNIYDNKAVLFKGEVKIYGIKDLFFRIGRMAQARKLFFEKYPEYTRKYSANRDLLPRAWQLTPVIARILVEVKPVDIIYWRGAKQIRVPV